MDLLQASQLGLAWVLLMSIPFRNGITTYQTQKPQACFYQVERYFYGASG